MEQEPFSQFSKLAEIQSALVEHKKTASELRRKLEQSETLIQQESANLLNVQSSLPWLMLEKFRDWHRRWFPAGSMRRKVYGVFVARLSSFLTRNREENSKVLRSARALCSDNPGAMLVDCEEPKPHECLSGTICIRGWIWAPSGETRVAIELNGRHLADAAVGLSKSDKTGSSRDARRSFTYIWDTNQTEQGDHELTIKASCDNWTRTRTIPIVIDQDHDTAKYQLWIRTRETNSEECKQGPPLVSSPQFSFILLAGKTPDQHTQQAIESINNQLYENWELHVVSQSEEHLQKTLSNKPHNKFFEWNARGQDCGEVIRQAISKASGEFICFLNNGDVLSRAALCSIAECLQEDRTADVFYADEDFVDITGERCRPVFKPDWSPDLLLSLNYTGRFITVRSAILRKLGSLRIGSIGSLSYDLMLQLSETTDRIRHIPRVLYHCHVNADNESDSAKDKALASEKAALADFLKRKNVAASVEPGLAPGTWRVRYVIRENPRVTIIIPCGPAVHFLRNCLRSIFEKTDYTNVDILLMDNSKGNDVHQLAKTVAGDVHNIAYVDYRGRPFNFSAINNYAVAQTTNPLVLFLNDDIEITTAGWLTALVEHGQRGEVGVVGGKLVYPDGLIQHAGIIMGIGGYAGHAFKRLPAETRAHFGFAQVVRNCSAVTGACMLTKRDLFVRLGGFNETELAVAFQDPDYCLRVRELGYLVVYTPYCTAIHHESASRGPELNRREVRYLQSKWASVIAHDPYYNPNLTRIAENFGIRLEPNA
jgi:GT2 family glycosyltransferase